MVFRFRRLLKWVVVLAVVAAVALVVRAGWRYSDRIRLDLLVPPASAAQVTVVAVAPGTVILPPTDATRQPIPIGVRWAGGIGELGPVLAEEPEGVTRVFTAAQGELAAGDLLTVGVARGSPADEGIPFQDVEVLGESGVLPAWAIAGVDDTWVVVVHDRDGREGVLPLLGPLVDGGFPVLVATMRNDPGAPPTADGLLHWGFHEWPDVEAAVLYAKANGAGDVILMGQGMGAEVVSLFLHSSREIRHIAGLIFDSPVLDLTAVEQSRPGAADSPSFVRSLGRGIASLRFEVEWSRLDQLARASDFVWPTLLLHGIGDEVAPVEVSRRFATAAAAQVTYVEFVDAPHGGLRAADSERYDQALAEFLDRVAAGPAVSG